MAQIQSHITQLLEKNGVSEAQLKGEQVHRRLGRVTIENFTRSYRPDISLPTFLELHARAEKLLGREVSVSELATFSNEETDGEGGGA